jgi:GNAT superfamily N-acetyltransferase
MGNMNAYPLSEKSAKQQIEIKPLTEADLDAADRVFRVAFGTFMGAPEPETFFGDADYVRTRWRANPKAAFAAWANGDLIGSNFAGKWGSVGFFGPLTVRPDFWDKSVGKHLMEPIMALFDEWNIKHAGLFTFAQSPKHVGLYQKFGFYPRFLTAITSKTVEPKESEVKWTRFSELPQGERDEALRSCRELTDSIYEGLDLELEIKAVADQHLGETVLQWDDDGLSGFAVCHAGAGSEAGSGACYVKFGAARPGAKVAENFARLLDACERMASAEHLTRLVAGVNAGRSGAYRSMLEAGFRADFQGVIMEKPNEAVYNRPDVYLIDDWR